VPSVEIRLYAIDILRTSTE